MKKDLPYLAWNAFLALSLIAARLFSVGFPVVIVGVFAAIELAVWLLAALLIGNKDIRAGIRKAKLIGITFFCTEPLMICIAIVCGNAKIAVAWIMIALVVSCIAIVAQVNKGDDEKRAEAK